MQPGVATYNAQRAAVSILTRPEGRVQLRCHQRAGGSGAFQSSPVPKDGCNVGVGPDGEPVFEVSILTRPEGRVQRSFAIPVRSCCSTFQSSPVPKDGCNGFNAYTDTRLGRVSILTRPEGRVQQDAARDAARCQPRFNPHPSRRTGATPYNRTKLNTAVELSRPTTVLNGAADDFHPHYTAFLRICQEIWLTSMPANLTHGA